MSMASPYVVIGRIGSTYGIRGWVKIQSFTEPVENIFDYSTWYVRRGNEWSILERDQVEISGPRFIVHIKGYDSPEHAKQLASLEIGVLREQLPPLKQGEYYFHDLVGLEVYSQSTCVGTVIEVMDNPAHPILVIAGEKQRLIPYVKEKIVEKVDLVNRRIFVNWDLEF